ncbi:hypothetical protein [Alicyclobacillus sp. ALC3]|uniref:hypothetical protein n=1 Tax=Alicyclobacillus sp. ALC3 TaxID=2796143 RepID=UPI002378BBE4|nr:hypothetical protein [Alicyclobacillus sp. ALC3]WDL97738.1 hypothetical protein JC200_03125 [Alicyclobacillus sp. ALC3]
MPIGPVEIKRTVPPGYLVGKTVAILGYSSEALDQAKALRNHGVRVVVSVREGCPTRVWEDAGFQTISLWEAVEISDVFQVW